MRATCREGAGMAKVQFQVEPHPAPQDEAVLRAGIVKFNVSCIHEQASHFCLFARDDGQLIGGASLWQHSDAFYIDVLWFEDNYRRQGLGSALLDRLDKQAVSAGIKKIFVDTFSFQARDFYEKNGFAVIACVPEYLLGHDRYFLKKSLSF
ncbi:N-acetyltransferase [Legionella taurinensis]|uniref:N-acetyltransferase n=2 Tax=Legionella taurinensis TaxID=70611 RepID=A0A3A5LC86_9GAMM|nr:hypothetical protein DB744_05570 [Legionella taurinensis]PUT44155.1 hypothetical protein DB746_03970 [Legionella taurinensis]PUT47456.1 hypothetical protein DB743_02140 [Legionella taurinensis]PUT48595.1 hypothetical protein DB745_03970 [Legionella taurinensis]RJT47961.1 GNAT family N-acetyltransferase [Legionella taurinensis]